MAGVSCTCVFVLVLSSLALSTVFSSEADRSSTRVVRKKALWYEFDVFGRKSEIKFEYTLPETATVQDDTLTFAPLPERTKRNIYGEDDRIQVDAERFTGTFPFSAVVRVSTGCTGMFVASRHVLTAAHCLWNHGQYKPGVSVLSIVISKASGQSTREFVTRYFIPGAWFNRTLSFWEEYDYALLEIQTAHGTKKRRGHIELGLGVDKPTVKQNGVGRLAEMIGYPDDKTRNTSWYVFCPVLATTSTRLYFECDAARGMSGSVVYVKEFECNTTQYVRRAIGVLSGTKYSVEDGREYNVAIRFNPEHYLQICHVIGKDKKCKDRYFYYFYSSRQQLQREYCHPQEKEHCSTQYGHYSCS